MAVRGRTKVLFRAVVKNADETGRLSADFLNIFAYERGILYE